MPDAYQRQLDHLAAMANNDAWKKYAWQRALELEACETGMWAGISTDLISTMKERS